ncbi:tektin-2 isoform X2 [Hydra vulgaris]|uniref:Tektin n=1 Tax=Hydra vulgaris TaxID=6087 RepID=A0ABM4D7B8_HYDVU
MTSKFKQKYDVSDWCTSNELLRGNAEHSRDASHSTRQEARRLINDTDNFTVWTQHESNCKLADRIDDINEWKIFLEKNLKDINKEIDALQFYKENTELSLETAKNFHNKTIECLMVRENRDGIDCVRDKVEEELHKDVEVIGSIKNHLQEKLNVCFDQLILLQETRNELSNDLSDKHHALGIDSKCQQLNNGNCNQLTTQLNSTSIPKEMVTFEKWRSFSEKNKNRAEAAIKASQNVRNQIYVTLEKTKNDFECKKKLTDYAFRKRINETEQVQDELKWQRQKTLDEIQTLQNDIEAIKKALEAKIAPLNVAHTRLECRGLRRNVELCQDNPYRQLSQEVGELRLTVETLLEKHQKAEVAMQKLLKDLARIEKDSEIKSKSLQLDNQCLKIRENAYRNLNTITQKNMSIGHDENKSNFCERQVHFLDQSLSSTLSETAHNVKKPVKHDETISTYDCDYNRFLPKRTNDLQRMINTKESLYA